MKGLIKFSGIIVMIVGVAILMGCAFTHNVNNNAILGVAALLVIIGLVGYILVNKYVQD